MEIPKDKIIELLRDRGQDDKADQADRELPDQVDTEQHADLLSKIGVDPDELAADLPGGLGDTDTDAAPELSRQSVLHPSGARRCEWCRSIEGLPCPEAGFILLACQGVCVSGRSVTAGVGGWCGSCAGAPGRW